MKILLAGLGFIDGDINYNKNVIINTIKKYNDVDMIVFGEAFLQGFNAVKFKYEDDVNVAVSINDDVINEITKTVKEYQVGLSFGYFEKDNDSIYSSQVTLDKEGNIIDNYRRVSEGWKEKYADGHYKEGSSFKSFDFLGKKFIVALCGDLWYDEYIDIIENIDTDIVLWPVYTDFISYQWNSLIKYEYAGRVQALYRDVLFVNSYKLNGSEEEAKGGCCQFNNDEIIKEIPSGKEDVLIVEIK